MRRRIGTGPVRRLFEILAGPLGQPRTPGIMFRGYRTVSFDGCKSIRVPDTAANRAWLGKLNAANGETGYPALSLMALAETGTRALLGAVFGPAVGGETGQARELLHLLDKTMLLLTDRGFDGGDFLAAVAATKRSSWPGSPAPAACPCSGTCPTGRSCPSSGRKVGSSPRR